MFDDLLETFGNFEENNSNEDKELEFDCPNCGIIPQDEVIFLCNKCDSKEMVYKDGTYLCPQCLAKGENFMCYNCDSKQVKLRTRI